MRLAVVSLTLTLLCGLATAQDQFENTRHGYTVEIPEGWHEVPSEFLTEFSRSVSSPEQPINYVQAFQKEPFADALVYPYVLIQSIAYREFGLDRPPTSDEMGTVVEAIVGVDISDTVEDSLTENITGLIEGQPAIQKLSFSSARSEFVYELDLAITNIGNVKGRARGVFGRRALLQPAYYALESDWADSESRVNAVLNSFFFFPDYAYPADAVGSQDELEVYEVTFERFPEPPAWVLIGGGVVLVVAIMLTFAFLMRWIDRRS